MTRLITLAALLATTTASLATHAAAPTVYEASVQGVTTRVELQINGLRFQARLSEPAMQLAMQGTVQGRLLSGQLQEPLTGLVLMPMAAELRGDELLLELRPPAAAPSRLSLRRVGAPAPATAATTATTAAGPAAIDAQLVGRWRHESQINSAGGAGGFASFSTVRLLELGADGRVRQSVRSVGGGGNWSADGGDRTEFTGRWQVRQGALWVQPEGQPGFVNAGRYRLVGERLVTENGQGRMIWSR